MQNSAFINATAATGIFLYLSLLYFHSDYMIKRGFKLQSAMEYLMTYGWAILIIAVVLGILFLLGVFNGTALLGNHCLTEVGFSCQSATFGTSGMLNMTIGQGTGQTIYIHALACSSSASSTGYPQYGLTGVTANVLGATGNMGTGTTVDGYYVTNTTHPTLLYETINGATVNSLQSSSPIPITSGSQFIVNLPCFNGQSAANGNNIAGLPLGQAFTGQVWINYSLTPTASNPIVQQLTTQLTEKAS